MNHIFQESDACSHLFFILTRLATNVSALKANIAALQEKVQAQRAHITQLLVAEEKETNASLAQRLPSG